MNVKSYVMGKKVKVLCWNSSLTRRFRSDRETFAICSRPFSLPFAFSGWTLPCRPDWALQFSDHQSYLSFTYHLLLLFNTSRIEGFKCFFFCFNPTENRISLTSFLINNFRIAHFENTIKTFWYKNLKCRSFCMFYFE